jgi:hypothetical protein
MLCRSRNPLSACIPLPDVESLGPNFVIGTGGKKVSAGMEVAMDECVSAKEVLSLLRRFEPLHLAFSPSCRPV